MKNIEAAFQDLKYVRSLIEASLDSFATISAEGKITDVNEATVKVTGATRQQLIGSDFCNYFTDAKKASQGYMKAFDKGLIADYALTIKHVKGTLTDVLYNASVYKDDDGNVVGVFASARDVTDKKWAKNLQIANKELAYQNDEKEKRAAELALANKELAYQNDEKEKRATELGIANKELAYQNDEKEKRAAELALANKELAYQNDEKEKRATELGIANKELAYQNNEKEKRATELVLANTELAYQNDEKEKRAKELGIANKELAYQNDEKEKRATELGIANKELAYQNDEKEKRATELVLANTELAYQNDEKEKRAKELGIANKELAYQNDEKEKRAAELVLANTELAYQNDEKEKRATESKILEAVSDSLKRASQYTRSLIEASRDPLFTISIDGKITDTNHASAKATGVSRELLIGTNFYSYFTEPDKAKEGYLLVFEKGFVTDYPLTISDHILTDVLFNGSVYKDENGKVLGAVVVARDITDIKRNEKELIEAKNFAELATSIAEEAKAVAENAAEISQDAVKAKQQFLSNMSHEIRTPMNAIIGFTKVLMKTDTTSKQQEYLNAIKTSGDALVVLINDILDLAKVDSGKMTFETIPFNLQSSISAMLHVFETKFLEKNLSLEYEFDPEIPKVLLGDPVRLHQIVLNLLSNAIKFTHKGTITLNIKLVSETNELVSVAFKVADTGIGISTNKIEQIFENFQQASSNTSRLFGGTGLGLAIVKQLVEAQGGEIHVESEINKGSSFEFTLSFGKTELQSSLDSAPLEMDEDIKNIRVLVVEDIKLNQLLIRTLLDEFGFEHDIAANGRIAIEKLKAKSYDIVLMDLQMPEMNGFEATDYIRNTMNSKIPIMALTADVTTTDLAKCTAVGMNDYVSKPIDEKLLYSKIVGLVIKPRVNTLNSRKENPISVEPKKITDLTYLNERTKSNAQLRMEMLEAYLDQTPALINALTKSFNEQDWEMLQATAHKIIPSFSIMGMNSEFEIIARKVQDYASDRHHFDGIHDLVIQLEQACHQACEEIRGEYEILKNHLK